MAIKVEKTVAAGADVAMETFITATTFDFFRLVLTIVYRHYNTVYNVVAKYL
jgi:hypothetical protein